MNLTTTKLRLCIFITLVAVLYDQLTKRIPSRLQADEAPRSASGFDRADALSPHDKPARAHGIEQVCAAQRLGRHTDWRPASSSYTASARTPTRRGDRRATTGLAISFRTTFPRRSTRRSESSSTTTTRTGREMLCRRAYGGSEGACSTTRARRSGGRRRWVCVLNPARVDC
jgi:hypothetical protein